MNRFRNELAPITDAAWRELQDQARQFLYNTFSLRRVADVTGPLGPETGAVSRGRLYIPENQPREGATVGINRVLPLLEARVPFELSQWELDNVERGAKDVDLDPLQKACWNLVRFEEETAFNGFEHVDLDSLTATAAHTALSTGGKTEKLLDAVTRATALLRKSMVQGPYALLAPEDVWQYLSSVIDGRPLRRHVEYLIEGPVLFSPFVPHTMLISLRGGDVEIVLGEDATIGFDGADTQSVKLYLSESFTVRVHDPEAFVFIE